jgi:hypothetical protein
MTLIPEFIAADVAGLWRWLGSHAFVVSMCINMAMLACLFALALHVVRLSSRHRQLAQDARRNAARLETLEKQSGACAEALVRLDCGPPRQPALAERAEAAGNRANAESADAAQVRAEIEHLRAEISSAREFSP